MGTTPMRKRFKHPNKQAAYELARRMGNDTSSTFYVDGKPHEGAGHRCAYWKGRRGEPTSYADPSIVAFPFWRAGADDREEIDGLKRGPTWKEWQAGRGIAGARLTPGK